MSVAELLRKRKEQLEKKNREEGTKYLQEYVNKDGVILLPSGVAYEIIVLGKGDKVDLSDRIECHYHGTNINGEVFDSSINRGKPASFDLNKLILAYQQVVPLLPIGTKFRMVTPPECAYRDQHVSKEIGPYSTLIFEVELLNKL
ncbi:FKBP-type peptidyl-prolyl cis-trans isomerase [Myroides odoratimimus]|uniref:FKBP-type peptidyl-prolyl cis-trans isomerase n=1 Tax=Myroides odoratimimus TaxID=76832 RepID=UPI00257528BF|nr:FKBP-type peptidyl-prolyl cis-trans isomerase [Myroides odoratimimus]MDM1528074.1 FKBP-type peptidyl-prolyl cis-trans isomerase [Myroides odoratimimus]